MRTFYAGLMILSLLLGLNLKIKVEAATAVKEVNTQLEYTLKMRTKSFAPQWVWGNVTST